MIVDIVASETLDLRQRVLRPFATQKECVYACDDLPETKHLGVRDSAQENRVLAILTMTPEAPPFDTSYSGIRLRGVAVDPDYHGNGYGSKLLQTAIEYSQHEKLLVWCNARLTARQFYERYGFASYGEIFMYPSEPRIGEHIVMFYDKHLS